MQMYSNDFLLKNMNFLKISKNIIFLKFHKKLPVTFNLTLIEQIDKWLAPQPWFSINFVWKIPTAFLVMNERITFKKNLKNYK